MDFVTMSLAIPATAVFKVEYWTGAAVDQLVIDKTAALSYYTGIPFAEKVWYIFELYLIWAQRWCMAQVV